MATLNGKELYIFKNYSAQIDEHANLNRVWDNVGNVVYINTDLDTIKNKIKSVYTTLKGNETLYFGKTSKFPRFKLTESGFKRCIKLDKADVFVINDINGRTNTFDNLIEDEVAYYLINNSAFKNIYCRNTNESRKFQLNPFDYIEKYLLYGNSIINKSTTQVKMSVFDGDAGNDVLKIMDGTYKAIVSDKDLDAAVNKKLDLITEEDLKSITELLDSPDKASQGIGLKMLGAYNINDIPLTIRTLLGFRRYLASCSEWTSVGVKNTLSTIKWDDFGDFPNYVRPIIQPGWKNQTYTQRDLDLCKNVYIDLIKKQIEDKVSQIRNMALLDTFNIKITYDVS